MPGRIAACPRKGPRSPDDAWLSGIVLNGGVTQLGRALSEVDIDILYANTPTRRRARVAWSVPI